MAGSPVWKVYRGREYIASCKYVEDAAAICALYDDGKIRHNHGQVVWSQRNDGDAGVSYDTVARVAHDRVRARAYRVAEQRRVFAESGAWGEA